MNWKWAFRYVIVIFCSKNLKEKTETFSWICSDSKLWEILTLTDSKWWTDKLFTVLNNRQRQTGVLVSPDAAEAICPKPLIEAEEGEDVFLRCLLDPSMDLSPYTVDWKRADDNKVVYSYRRGQENQHDQMEQYRNGSSLNLRDLSRGNMTLLISSVRLSDTGRYKCFVPKWWISCLVSLRVGKKVFIDTVFQNESDSSFVRLLEVILFCLLIYFFTTAPKHQHTGTKTDTVSTTKPPQDDAEDPGKPGKNGSLGQRFSRFSRTRSCLTFLYPLLITLIRRVQSVSSWKIHLTLWNDGLTSLL